MRAATPLMNEDVTKEQVQKAFGGVFAFAL